MTHEKIRVEMFKLVEELDATHSGPNGFTEKQIKRLKWIDKRVRRLNFLLHKYDQRDADLVTQDLLLLVGYRVTFKEMRKWSELRREDIEEWATCCHLRASDNNIIVPPKPRFAWKPLNKSGFQKQLRLL